MSGTPRVPAPRSAGSPYRDRGDLPLGDAARYAAYVLLLVLGGVVGIAGCFAQALWFPGGLLLALAGTAGLFYGGLRLTGTRLGAVFPAVGWFVVLLLAMSPTPEGDFLLASSIGAYAYLLVGAISGVICATLPIGGPFPMGGSALRPPRR